MEENTRKQEADALAAVMVAAASQPTTALYVINLCASMTPIAHADKQLPGFENYRLYQVSRKEDGRIRYRLRLGFFTDESEAETALACIREHYPTAFAASLGDEDRKHTRGFAGASTSDTGSRAAPVPKETAPPRPPVDTSKTASAPPVRTAGSTQSAAPAKPVAPAPSPRSVAPAAPAAPTPAPTDTQKAAALKATRAPIVEIEWHDQASTAAATAKPSAAAPANASVSQSAAKPVAPTGVKPPAPSQATVTPAPAAAQTLARKTPEAPNVTPTLKPAAPSVELSLASDTAIRARPQIAAQKESAQPFHVGNGVQIRDTGITLEAEAKNPSAKAAAPAKAVAPAPAKPATRAPVTPSKPQVAKPVAPPPAARKPDLPAKMVPPAIAAETARPDLDSTQTIRALTAAELSDENQPKWFAVQLAVSEQPINLDTMPMLDIFTAYSLYSVASAGSGKIMHHLRLGFFKEEVSAEAVSGYLKTFFASPTVLRISTAEQARFAEKDKPAAGEPRGKVIELAAARDRAPAKDAVPVVTMEVPTGNTGRFPKLNTSATGTFRKPDMNATGAFKQPDLTASGAFRTGSQSAAKTAGPAVKRSEPKHMKTGKHRSLEQQLLEEARQVELEQSGIRKLPKDGLLSKFFGKK